MKLAESNTVKTSKLKKKSKLVKSNSFYARHPPLCFQNNRMNVICVYTGCPRRNVPDFGRVFLRSNYTNITQHTYIQSSMVTEILAREKCGILWCIRTILCPWRDPLDLHRDNPAVACRTQRRPWLRNRCSECIMLGTQWTTMTRVRVFL